MGSRWLCVLGTDSASRLSEGPRDGKALSTNETQDNKKTVHGINKFSFAFTSRWTPPSSGSVFLRIRVRIKIAVEGSSFIIFSKRKNRELFQCGIFQRA